MNEIIFVEFPCSNGQESKNFYIRYKIRLLENFYRLINEFIENSLSIVVL